MASVRNGSGAVGSACGNVTTLNRRTSVKEDKVHALVSNLRESNLAGLLLRRETFEAIPLGYASKLCLSFIVSTFMLYVCFIDLGYTYL